MMKATFSWRNPAMAVQPERPVLKKFIERAAALAKLPTDFDWTLNVIFVGDKKMAQANADYVGHIGTTDVITFSYLDDMDSVFPGDTALELLICTDFAAREGMRRKHSYFERELLLYIVHGILHAAKYDDLDALSRRKMRSAERRLMKKLEQEFNFHELFRDKGLSFK